MKEYATNGWLKAVLTGLLFCSFQALSSQDALGQTDDVSRMRCAERITERGVYFGENENNEPVTLYAQSVVPGSSGGSFAGVVLNPGGGLVQVSGILTYIPGAGSVVVMFRADGLTSKLNVPDSSSDSLSGYSLKGKSASGETVNDELTIEASENGKVTAFQLGGNVYTWNSKTGKYHGAIGSAVWTSYSFYSNGDGSYSYTLTSPPATGSTLVESGTATPNS